MGNQLCTKKMEETSYTPVARDAEPVGFGEAPLAAASWLSQADAVLICAGAGMSLNEGYNVYVNEREFANHYPWFPKWGYRTAYQCMGLFADRAVPMQAKWAFWATHMDNMRWKFPVHTGYELLLEMVQDKDYFVYTSNVDGCFQRAGFDPQKIYTPQGDWAFYQCMGKTGREGPCRPTSVFPSREMLDVVLPKVTNGELASQDVPQCPVCGGQVFGNVRGGDWFLHKPYDAANSRFVEWVEEVIALKRSLVVLEIGCGFNTPGVTRWPMEAITREAAAAGGALIRVNPTEAEVPPDLPRAIGLPSGWEIVGDLQELAKSEEPEVLHAAEERVLARKPPWQLVGGNPLQKKFNWRQMLADLSR